MAVKGNMTMKEYGSAFPIHRGNLIAILPAKGLNLARQQRIWARMEELAWSRLGK